jgi:hypothetical protein
MQTITVKLTRQQVIEVSGWLHDQLDELEADEESLKEERPGLLDGLAALHEALDP